MKTEELFNQLVNRIKKQRGKSLRGVHLHCRNCGEQGFANSLEVARMLGGWTKVRKHKRSHYRGLCIECSPKAKNKRR